MPSPPWDLPVPWVHTQGRPKGPWGSAWAVVSSESFSSLSVPTGVRGPDECSWNVDSSPSRPFSQLQEIGIFFPLGFRKLVVCFQPALDPTVLRKTCCDPVKRGPGPLTEAWAVPKAVGRPRNSTQCLCHQSGHFLNTHLPQDKIIFSTHGNHGQS
jgi:hypothetical protein